MSKASTYVSGTSDAGNSVFTMSPLEARLGVGISHGESSSCAPSLKRPSEPFALRVSSSKRELRLPAPAAGAGSSGELPKSDISLVDYVLRRRGM